MTSKYVAGFLFDWAGDRVALIEKLKPEWQKGNFNAIGGKIEDSEDPQQAMSREFLEETGVTVAPHRWFEYCRLTDSRDYIVSFFYAHADDVELSSIQHIEDERPAIFNTKQIPQNIIPNLSWLIPMALTMEGERAESFDVIEKKYEVD